MRRTPYTCTECGQPILFYEKMPTTAEERHVCADCRRMKAERFDEIAHCNEMAFYDPSGFREYMMMVHGDENISVEEHIRIKFGGEEE